MTMYELLWNVVCGLNVLLSLLNSSALIRLQREHREHREQCKQAERP